MGHRGPEGARWTSRHQSRIPVGNENSGMNCHFWNKNAFFCQKDVNFSTHLRGFCLYKLNESMTWPATPGDPNRPQTRFFLVISGKFCRFLQNSEIFLEFLGHAWSRPGRDWVGAQFGRRGYTPCHRIDRLLKPNCPPDQPD